MKKYECLVQPFDSDNAAKKMKFVSDGLTALGEDGWELVAVVPIQDYHGEVSLFYFKREKPN